MKCNEGENWETKIVRIKSKTYVNFLMGYSYGS